MCIRGRASGMVGMIVLVQIKAQEAGVMHLKVLIWKVCVNNSCIRLRWIFCLAQEQWGELGKEWEDSWLGSENIWWPKQTPCAIHCHVEECTERRIHMCEFVLTLEVSVGWDWACWRLPLLIWGVISQWDAAVCMAPPGDRAPKLAKHNGVMDY